MTPAQSRVATRGYPTEEFKNLKCESEENKAISEMGVVTEYNYHTSTHVSRV